MFDVAQQKTWKKGEKNTQETKERTVSCQDLVDGDPVRIRRTLSFEQLMMTLFRTDMYRTQWRPCILPTR
jgi:hypothetical protein